MTILTNLEAQDIRLPEPRKEGGMPLMEAFSKRVSARDYSDQQLSPQTLSDLLWAAWGYNREKKRTAPSSHNRQETELYVFLRSGTYIYDAKENILRQINSENLSALTGTQDFPAKAPLNIAMVADRSKIKGKTPQGIIETIYVDTGFISQNIYLFCASEGLSTVVRAMVPKEELASAIGLSEEKTITLVQSVGYPVISE